MKLLEAIRYWVRDGRELIATVFGITMVISGVLIFSASMAWRADPSPIALALGFVLTPISTVPAAAAAAVYKFLGEGDSVTPDDAR